MGYPRFARLPAGAAGTSGRDSDVADYRHQREKKRKYVKGIGCRIWDNSTSIGTTRA